jgi:hypothetical protein
MAAGAASTFCLVIVAGIKIDGAERVQNLQLLAPANILIERGIHRLFLGLVTTRPAGFLDELIVQGKIGRMCRILHTSLCESRKEDLSRHGRRESSGNWRIHLLYRSARVIRIASSIRVSASRSRRP